MSPSVSYDSRTRANVHSCPSYRTLGIRPNGFLCTVLHLLSAKIHKFSTTHSYSSSERVLRHPLISLFLFTVLSGLSCIIELYYFLKDPESRLIVLATNFRPSRGPYPLRRVTRPSGQPVPERPWYGGNSPRDPVLRFRGNFREDGVQVNCGGILSTKCPKRDWTDGNRSRTPVLEGVQTVCVDLYRRFHQENSDCFEFWNRKSVTSV